MMAPVEIVQVVGMGNALWRLGHERFDSVLLDADLADRQVIRRCREQIADIAAVPVLDLADPARGRAAAPARSPSAAAPAARGRGMTRSERQTLRLPWQRRPRRARTRPGPKSPTAARPRRPGLRVSFRAAGAEQRSSWST